MERKQMNEILEEQSFQNSGICDNQSCIVEMGRLLTVKYIVGQRALSRQCFFSDIFAKAGSIK
jgi:hypothetical protein